MQLATIHIFYIVLYVTRLQITHGNLINSKMLCAGEELQDESLPLQSGSRLYQLQGLKSLTWYEVKISYPASIPATFSLELNRGNSDLELKHQRKLLNTEKLIFKTDGEEFYNDQRGVYVLVTVEPAGVVAIPHAQERKYVIFNIVCDELLLGIPHKGWWIVILGILCLVLAFVIPSFLPPFLLHTDRRPELGTQFASKDS